MASRDCVASVSYTHLDVYKRQISIVPGDNLISGWSLLKNTRTLIKFPREARHVSKVHETQLINCS